MLSFTLGEIGLDPDMIKLAEADIGFKYTKGTDYQKTIIHAAARAISSHMLLSLGRQAPTWQTHYGTMWYHKNGIANILSLAKLSREHEVKFNSANGNRFERKTAMGK